MSPVSNTAVVAAAAALREARTSAPALHRIAIRLATVGIHVGLTRIAEAAAAGNVLAESFVGDAQGVVRRLEELVAEGSETVSEVVEHGYDGEDVHYEVVEVTRREPSAEAALEGVHVIRGILHRLERVHDLLSASVTVLQMQARLSGESSAARSKMHPDVGRKGGSSAAA